MTEQQHYRAAMTLVLRTLDQVGFSDAYDVVEELADTDQWGEKQCDLRDIEAVRAKIREARNMLAGMWGML